MKKIYFLTLILTFCLFTSACVSKNVSNEIEQPKELVVEQTSTLENWDISVAPRLDHKKWVYDTAIKYLGDKTVKLTVNYYDKTKVTYNDLAPLQVQKSFGSFDYEKSVYSKQNKDLSFNLKWVEGIKTFSGDTEFKIKPKNH
ncbi:hypothetical protein [Neobacillus drentensis]|uniref:hypothetical protein n=1 Tax=Neobacillus drentensis TaxID=220684 RepID=UPI0030017950